MLELISSVTLDRLNSRVPILKMEVKSLLHRKCESPKKWYMWHRARECLSWENALLCYLHMTQLDS